MILLSIEEGCPQDLNGLSKTFLKSVYLGMRNGNVRNELRESAKTLFKDPNDAEKDDNELMGLISEAMANEKARAERLKEAKEVELNMMQTNTENKMRKRTVSFNDPKEKPTPLAQIAELREKQDSQTETLTSLVAQVLEIRDHLVGGDRTNKSVPSVPAQQVHPAPSPLMQPLLNAPSAAPPGSSQPYNRLPQNQRPFHHQPLQNVQNSIYIPPHRRGFCQKCISENKLRCLHCFYCGKESPTHKSFDCPEKNC